MKKAAERYGHFGLIEGTKDIWARDYMPVQVSENEFVSFLYEPDYLMKDDHGRALLTNSHEMAVTLPFRTKQVNIKLDGGNIVSNGSVAFMCDKIFDENPDWKEHHLGGYLTELLKLNGIIFIPTGKEDPIGHADGIIRFINEDAVLMMDYSKIDSEYHHQVLKVLKDYKVEVEILPYQEPRNLEGA
ncbi:MAG: agmatine deiminase family protein, partial [Bacteroidota bacterium]|nr:agmatine deiminase family protein [Bacteroidota bacterium]